MINSISARSIVKDVMNMNEDHMIDVMDFAVFVNWNEPTEL